MIDSGFETTSLRMTLLLLVTFQAPAADVDRIMDAVVAIAPLAMGKYDRNAYQSAHGIERYRPLEGDAAGACATADALFEVTSHPAGRLTHGRAADRLKRLRTADAAWRILPVLRTTAACGSPATASG